MSRIGQRIIKIPENVNVEFKDQVIKVNGPLGSLEQYISPKVKLVISDKEIKVLRENNEKAMKMIHGTTNSLIFNMILGVTKGFQKDLIITGVGYNVVQKGNNLIFSLGYSHKINLEVPSNIKVEIKKPTELTVKGIDKQLVGQFASKIRLFKKPEPYGGKGIKYKDERIIRKSGKASSK